VSESRIGQHQELEERFQAVVSERYGAAGAPTAELAISNAREATQRASYVVGISNGTDSTFTVVNWHFVPLRRGFGRRKGSARKLATRLHVPIFGN
jgi:hypothetical protein